MSTISASTTSTTAFKITTDTTGTLVFQTGASPTTAVTFDASQNVGVSVTPSVWRSNYKAVQFGNGGNLIGRTDSTALYLGANWYVNSSNQDIYVANGNATVYTQNNTGQHAWYNASSGTAGGTITFTQALTLDSNGYLGIGSTAPGAPLHIYSGTQEQIRLGRNSTASSGYVTFYANNASSAQVQYAGILGDVASSTAGSHGGNLLFYTTGSGASAERARIDSSGRFIVGGTTAYGVAATFTGQGGSVVANQASSLSYAGFRIYNDIASPSRALEIDYSGSAYASALISGGPIGESAVMTTTGAYPLTLGTNNTARLTIASDGNMIMSGTIRPAAILSPNTSTVVAADSALPSTGSSLLYTLAYGPGGNDGHLLGMTWTDPTQYGAQLWFDTDPTYLMAMRQRSNLGAWNAWSYLLNTNTYKVYTTQGGGSTSSSGTRATVTITLASSSNKILVFGSDLLRCSSGYIRGIVYIDSTIVEAEYMYQQVNGNIWQTTTGIATINNAAAGSHTISLYADFGAGGGAWDGPTYLQVIVWDGI